MDEDRRGIQPAVIGQCLHQRAAPAHGVAAEGLAIRGEERQRALDLEEVLVQVQRDQLAPAARGHDVATPLLDLAAKDPSEQRRCPKDFTLGRGVGGDDCLHWASQAEREPGDDDPGEQDADSADSTGLPPPRA